MIQQQQDRPLRDGECPECTMPQKCAECGMSHTYCNEFGCGGFVMPEFCDEPECPRAAPKVGA